MVIYLWVREDSIVDGWSSTESPNTVAIDIPEDHAFLMGDPQEYILVDGGLMYNNELVLKRAKQDKNIELNEACRQSILAGFSHVVNGETYWFSYDMEAQGNFRDLKEALKDGITTEELWTVRKGGINGEYTRIPINMDIMNELRVVIMNHKTEKISKYRDFLMPIVLSATTVEEVRSVQW